MSLLEVTGLKKYFPCQRSFIENLLTRTKDYVHAVDGGFFSIDKGKIFTLAGISMKALRRLGSPTSLWVIE